MIVFPPREEFDDERDEVRFPVMVIGKPVVCRVAAAGLASRYGGGDRPGSVLELFRARRVDLEAQVRRKLLQGQYEPDRTILIRADDLARA